MQLWFVVKGRQSCQFRQFYQTASYSVSYASYLGKIEKLLSKDVFWRQWQAWLIRDLIERESIASENRRTFTVSINMGTIKSCTSFDLTFFKALRGRLRFLWNFWPLSMICPHFIYTYNMVCHTFPNPSSHVSCGRPLMQNLLLHRFNHKFSKTFTRTHRIFVSLLSIQQMMIANENFLLVKLFVEEQ